MNGDPTAMENKIEAQTTALNSMNAQLVQTTTFIRGHVTNQTQINSRLTAITDQHARWIHDLSIRVTGIESNNVREELKEVKRDMDELKGTVRKWGGIFVGVVMVVEALTRLF